MKKALISNNISIGKDIVCPNPGPVYTESRFIPVYQNNKLIGRPEEILYPILIIDRLFYAGIN